METKSKLQEILEDAGMDLISYSGRGMYGEQCLAIRTSYSLGVVVSEILDGAIKVASDGAAELEPGADDVWPDETDTTLRLDFSASQETSNRQPRPRHGGLFPRSQVC